jgi:hypothetical protein
MPQGSERTLFNLLLVLYSGMAIDARSRYQEEKGLGVFICNISSCAHHYLELYDNIGSGIAIQVKCNTSKTQCNAIV